MIEKISIFQNHDAGWTVVYDVVMFFVPLLAVSALLSLLLSSPLLWKVISSRFQDGLVKFTQQILFIMSFCIAGIVVGMIIYLLGGFSLGSKGEETSSSQFIATLVSSFAAIAGLFFGENKIGDSVATKPIGTASAILMMMIGYFYLGEMFRVILTSPII